MPVTPSLGQLHPSVFPRPSHGGERPCLGTKNWEMENKGSRRSTARREQELEG